MWDESLAAAASHSSSLRPYECTIICRREGGGHEYVFFLFTVTIICGKGARVRFLLFLQSQLFVGREGGNGYVFFLFTVTIFCEQGRGECVHFLPFYGHNYL